MPNSNSNTPLTSETIVCRSSSPLFTQIDKELVLMSIEHGNYYGLDAIATDIWQRLEQPIAVAALSADLADQYDAETPTIQRDVLALLEKLRAEGFLDIVG